MGFSRLTWTFICALGVSASIFLLFAGTGAMAQSGDARKDVPPSTFLILKLPDEDLPAEAGNAPQLYTQIYRRFLLGESPSEQYASQLVDGEIRLPLEYRNGERATRVRGVLISEQCGLHLIDVQPVPPEGDVRMEIPCEPPKKVVLRGEILGYPHTDQLRVRAEVWDSWVIHSFFQWGFGGIGSALPMGSLVPVTGGRFTLELPYYGVREQLKAAGLREPYRYPLNIYAGLASEGAFPHSCILRNMDAPDENSPDGSLPIAPEYPEPVRFLAECK